MKSLLDFLRNILRCLRRWFSRAPLQPYPASHSEAAAGVLKVVQIIRAAPASTDPEIVAALVQDGLSKTDAELLVLLVPSAFSWAILRKTGIKSFPNMFAVMNRFNRPVFLPIAGEHYFTTALQMGFDLTTHGQNQFIDREAFEAVASRSAEIDILNNYLNSGNRIEDFASCKLQPLVLCGITFEEIVHSRPKNLRPRPVM